MKKKEKSQPSLGIKLSIPSFSYHYSATELWQPANHQPSQSSIHTAQVVPNASVVHPAATQYGTALAAQVVVWFLATADFPPAPSHNIKMLSGLHLGRPWRTPQKNLIGLSACWRALVSAWVGLISVVSAWPNRNTQAVIQECKFMVAMWHGFGLCAYYLWCACLHVDKHH